MTLHAILEGEKCSEEKMDWNVLMQCRIFPECSLWTILDVPELLIARKF